MRFLTLIAATALLSSCAVGGGGKLTFDYVRYPVSGNHKLLDRNGAEVDAKRSADLKGKVKIENRFWSIGYGFIQLSDDRDLGPDINQKVEEMGGNAIINAQLKSSPCGWDHFTVLIGFLPFIPGCSYTEFTGDVIQVSPTE